MGRQDIIDHIEAELGGDTEYSAKDMPQPTLCQQCGMEIAAASGTVPADHGDYVVHRVPTQGESDLQSVFYCSSSCFTESMEELFSPGDE